MTKRRGNPNYSLQPRDPVTKRWIKTMPRALEEPTRDHLIRGPVVSGDTARHAPPVAGPVMLRLQGVGGPSALQTEAMYPVRVPVPVSLDEPQQEIDEHGIEPSAPIPASALLVQPALVDPRPQAAVTKFRRNKLHQHPYESKRSNLIRYALITMFLLAIFSIFLSFMYNRF